MASRQCDIAYDSGGGVMTATATLTDGTTHASPLTTTGAAGGTDFVDISKVRYVSIQVVNGSNNGFTFTVEGSDTPTAANFKTVAYGEGSSAAYTQAPKTVAADGIAMLYLPDADAFRYLRLNVSAGNTVGTTVTVFGRS